MDDVEFFRHDLGEEEQESIIAALGSVFLTTGPRTAKFEERFAQLLGARHAIGLSSCTAALFLSLKALEIGAGDEVITTPLSFIATSNAILHAGARPVFVDVEQRTGCIDLSQVERAISERTRAVMPVHLYGQMVDMRGLRALADRHGLAIIEDAAHAVEADRDGVRPGMLGDIACFSFYATKNMTSGEGGAAVTNDDTLARKLRTLRTHGMTKEVYARHQGDYQHWDMKSLGYKANMFDLQAALLLPQLERVEERWTRRDGICREYEAALRTLPNVDHPETVAGSKNARHLFTVWVPPARRDEILSALQGAGVGVAVNYRAIHLLSYYAERFGYRRGDYPNAEQIGDGTISLPLYPGLTTANALRVVDQLRRVMSGEGEPQ